MSSHGSARMVGISVENKGSCSALLHSGIDLIRKEQRRVGRGEFWEFLVARLFNEPTKIVTTRYRRVLDADGEFSDIGLNLPFPQVGSSVWRKEKYFGVWASFNRAYFN